MLKVVWKPRLILRNRWTAGLVALALAGAACAKDVTLTLATATGGNHRYFHRLLEESLKAAGHRVKIDTIENLPQTRIAAYVDSGALSLHWFLQTKERDARYAAVDFNLTRGLVGQRILLIPQGDEAVYSKVTNLQEFRALNKIAGLGQDWFDVGVWKESGLNVAEQPGDWKVLYNMVAAKNRRVDYFPRGAHEIAAEAKAHPKLAIEPRLLLIYPRDLRFYLNVKEASLKPVIEAALAAAEKSGLQKRLFDEFYGPSIAAMGLNKRVHIYLKDTAD